MIPTLLRFKGFPSVKNQPLPPTYRCKHNHIKIGDGSTSQDGELWERDEGRMREALHGITTAGLPPWTILDYAAHEGK